MVTKWQISKQFDFCYGHRVWSQKLIKEYALDECLMCRHLHGHQGKILVHLQSDRLINAMVTDFKHLNWFKQFLDDTLDHKFIIDINDPLFNTLLPHYKNKINLIKMKENYYIVDLSILKDEPIYIYEMYEGFVLVDFVPTSENLSAWLLGIVAKKMKQIDIKVSHLEYFETPKSKSVVFSDA
ncbi:6-carboxytetrahydropterin synthase @ Queuosine biosynthesis QueD, PTPS-I [hydrothermal vent metagenome]|uniref:6-carboxytetrahydropterin synthase @ Queuosine biosynthesis QueD, PTPS-I n=1 Tax=hydrothermal vent metagenome TaxID=652676 RepID=A0A3B1DTM5_9ZZZZ